MFFISLIKDCNFHITYISFWTHFIPTIEFLFYLFIYLLTRKILKLINPSIAQSQPSRIYFIVYYQNILFFRIAILYLRNDNSAKIPSCTNKYQMVVFLWLELIFFFWRIEKRHWDVLLIFESFILTSLCPSLYT